MRIVREIDRGGFGIVHEVQLPDRRRVARKSFDPQIGSPEEREKLRKRFQREVRIQSQIVHPNIMPILDYDLEAAPPWFTMPLAERSFEKKLMEDHATDSFDADPWQDILAAVEELHRLGYVHRDLKPANILCVGGSWVLSDFGLILPTSRETTVLTGSKSAYGSLSYAAPEQARDFRNTPEQADIFALGCILHDAIEPSPVRIPFAQIRSTGPYAALLEKCTETEPKKRFPNIGALRAALFDLWRVSRFTPPPADEASLLDALLADPDNIDAWRSLIGYVEKSPSREAALRALSAELLTRLHAVDDILFSRAMHLICSWAKGSSFDWDYCDVVGDRLLEAYRIGTVRVRCEIVLAALELAVSHNRWHVMSQVGAMLGPAADNGLVDRILIEISLDGNIASQLRRVERIIHWPREHWHERIATYLKESDPPKG
jgi:eukaryotic-like serine/threonine-protein kinase